MFRAIILWLLGATFEVRVISLRTGKKIPGRCMYRGGYWKARKVYKKKRLKYAQMMRLQAVSILNYQINDVKPAIRVELTGLTSPNLNVSIHPSADEEQLVNVEVTDEGSLRHDMGLPGVDDLDDPVSAVDEDGWTKPGLIGELNVETGVVTEHECNAIGPLDWYTVTGGYVSTCSICGKFPSENVADAADSAQ